MGDAATDELVRGILPEVDAGIEAPPLGAAGRVEGDDLVEGRAEDEASFTRIGVPWVAVWFM